MPSLDDILEPWHKLEDRRHRIHNKSKMRRNFTMRQIFHASSSFATSPLFIINQYAYVYMHFRIC